MDNPYVQMFMDKDSLAFVHAATFENSARAAACLAEIDALTAADPRIQFSHGNQWNWWRRTDGTIFLHFTQQVPPDYRESVQVIKDIFARHGGVTPQPWAGMVDLRPGKADQDTSFMPGRYSAES